MPNKISFIRLVMNENCYVFFKIRYWFNTCRLKNKWNAKTTFICLKESRNQWSLNYMRQTKLRWQDIPAKFTRRKLSTAWKYSPTFQSKHYLYLHSTSMALNNRQYIINNQISIWFLSMFKQKLNKVDKL